MRSLAVRAVWVCFLCVRRLTQLESLTLSTPPHTKPQLLPFAAFRDAMPKLRTLTLDVYPLLVEGYDDMSKEAEVFG